MKKNINQTYQWIYESFSLLKRHIRFSLLAGMFYLMFYMFVPATPGLNVLSPLLIILWPFVTILIVGNYLSKLNGQALDIKMLFNLLRQKLSHLIFVGLLSIAYTIFLSAWLSADMTRIIELSQSSSELEKISFNIISPILIKILLATIPFIMLTWFAPLLIVFKNYNFLKSIKSSFAACLIYLIPLLLSWLFFISIFLLVIFIVSFIASSLSPLLSSFFILILVTIYFALTFAFQGITYKTIFK
jgi:hypothetical protein